MNALAYQLNVKELHNVTTPLKKLRLFKREYKTNKKTDGAPFVKLYQNWQNHYALKGREDYQNLWKYLILKASYQESTIKPKNEKIILQRGQLFITYPELANRIYQDRDRTSPIRRVLKEWETEGMITLERLKGNIGHIVTVTNYDKYQSKEAKVSKVYYVNFKENENFKLESFEKNSRQTTDKQQTNDRQTADHIYNKDNKDNKDKKEVVSSYNKDNNYFLYKKNNEELERYSQMLKETFLKYKHNGRILFIEYMKEDFFNNEYERILMFLAEQNATPEDIERITQRILQAEEYVKLSYSLFSQKIRESYDEARKESQEEVKKVQIKHELEVFNSNVLENGKKHLKEDVIQLNEDLHKVLQDDNVKTIYEDTLKYCLLKQFMKDKREVILTIPKSKEAAFIIQHNLKVMKAVSKALKTTINTVKYETID